MCSTFEYMKTDPDIPEKDKELFKRILPEILDRDVRSFSFVELSKAFAKWDNIDQLNNMIEGLKDKYDFIESSCKPAVKDLYAGSPDGDHLIDSIDRLFKRMKHRDVINNLRRVNPYKKIKAGGFVEKFFSFAIPAGGLAYAVWVKKIAPMLGLIEQSSINEGTLTQEEIRNYDSRIQRPV